MSEETPVLPFAHEQLAQRTVFGVGRLDTVKDEGRRLGASRVLVIAAEPEAELGGRLRELLGPLAVDTWSQVRQHVPSELADAAARHAAELDVDLLVTVGGGSTTGLGKAISRRTHTALLAVPTTYAGSEKTPIWGETAEARKTTGRDPFVLPRTVIYDPLLTLTLPAHISGTSGMNALAHCVEAVYAADANPITTQHAVMAVRALSTALPRVVTDPGDVAARSEALYGSMLAGLVLATAGISLHHHVCHVLGGMFDLPHADLHTVVLPHAVAAVQAGRPDALAPLAAALGTSYLPQALYSLSQTMHLPDALAPLGMSDADISSAVPRCVESTAVDVVALTDASATTLLRAAVHGGPPRGAPADPLTTAMPSWPDSEGLGVAGYASAAERLRQGIGG